MTNSLGVRLRAVTPDDIPGLIALARAAFDTNWTEAFVAWKYFQNPAGSVVGACADSDGRVVASFGHTPVRLKLGNAAATSVQSVDAMVLPEFRRQKLFYQLAQQTYTRLDAAGMSPAYVFPAAAVRTPFVGQFGYAEAGPVPRFVKVVQSVTLGQSLGRPGPKSWLDRLAWLASRARRAALSPAPSKAGLRLAAISQFDDRFDQLWQQASAVLTIGAIRDAAYLNWRYCQNPLRDYTILTVECGLRLAGYAILSVDPQRQVTHIVELLVDVGQPAAGYWLLADATERARQAGCAQIQCWMLPQHRFYVRLLEQSGFAFWPSRALPGWLGYTTPFIVRAGPGEARAIDVTTLGNWFLSMGDHDYY